MPDVSLTITLGDAIPAYKQIVDQLRLLVQTGMLPVGYALPGVRQLASQLGVHHNTVAEAYRTLAAEGLLDLSHGRRATIALAAAPQPLTSQELSALRTRLRTLVAELRFKGVPASTILNDVTTLLGN